jgi:CubicO group peptidase (beta-lactamase class C family)
MTSSGAQHRACPPLGWLPILSESTLEADLRGRLAASAGHYFLFSAVCRHNLERPFPELAELQQLVENVLEPNEQFKYSNIGFSLLGQVVDAVSGRPYKEFVTAEIVDKLGLHSTGPETHPGMADRLVRGYTPWRPDLPRVPIADRDALGGTDTSHEEVVDYAYDGAVPCP